MAELKDINGVGDARASSLEEAGYDSVEAVAEADPEDLEEAGFTGDSALETVVQAQNIVESERGEEENQGRQEVTTEPRESQEEVQETDEADPESDEFDLEEDPENPEDQEVDEDEEDEDVEDAEVEAEETDESEEDETYSVDLAFDSREQFDVFHAAMVEHWQDSYDTRVDSDVIRDVLDEIDNFESLSLELTADELNAVHTAVNQERLNYQGANRINQMDHLRGLEDQLNERREEELF